MYKKELDDYNIRWKTLGNTHYMFLDIYKSFDIVYTEKGEICVLLWYSIYNSKTISYSVQYWHEKHLSSFFDRIRHTFIYIDIFEKYLSAHVGEKVFGLKILLYINTLEC